MDVLSHSPVDSWYFLSPSAFSSSFSREGEISTPRLCVYVRLCVCMHVNTYGAVCMSVTELDVGHPSSSAYAFIS